MSRDPRPCRDCGVVFALAERQPSHTSRCPDCLNPVRTCPTCGATFTRSPVWRANRFCSVACSKRTPEARASMAAVGRANGTNAPRPCRKCGVMFIRYKHPAARYCSTACYHASAAGAVGGLKSAGKPRRGPRTPDPPAPTQAEIAEQAAVIRSGWTEEEREQRAVADRE